MKQHEGYLQRVADIDAKVQRAQLDPDTVFARAAGLLAGRVGCLVDDAHAHLLKLAAEQGLDPWEVAAEVLSALQARAETEPTGLRAATEHALGVARHPVQRRRRSDTDHDDWAALMRQVLDAVLGKHVALLPVGNDRGEPVDYRIVAASPPVSDPHGRPSTLVDQHMGRLFPSLRGGPLWEAWWGALADGGPREVADFPFVDDAGGEPKMITIAARVQPVGPGLLSSWVRKDEEAQQAGRVVQTERLGNVGWGEWDLVTDTIVWSEELYRIYERDPVDGPIPREVSEGLILPEDQPIRRLALERFGRGETIDMQLRIRVGGRIKHIRVVADAVRDMTGRPLKIYGIVHDVTPQETSRAKLAEAQEQLRTHQQVLAAEHRLAVDLQQIVLPIPAAPIDLPGLRVALRYLPAEQACRVGGDWFGASCTRDGGVILAIGDVAGHGLRAATTMAQLRHALTALTVTITTDPAVLMSHLNELMYEGSPTAGTATAVVARYEPGTGTMVWAQAGHPAVLHSRAGTTTELARPEGPLLGAIRNARYHTATARFSAGDLLVFYTDGLIEHRSHSLAEGLAPVIATLNRFTAESCEEPLDDLLAQLRRANPDDDTCILAVLPLPRNAAWRATVDGHLG